MGCLVYSLEHALLTKPMLEYCSQVLWRGQEKIMADVAPPEDWDKGAGINIVDEF